MLPCLQGTEAGRSVEYGALSGRQGGRGAQPSLKSYRGKSKVMKCSVGVKVNNDVHRPGHGVLVQD